jgi:hypothetical protein
MVGGAALDDVRDQRAFWPVEPERVGQRLIHLLDGAVLDVYRQGSHEHITATLEDSGGETATRASSDGSGAMGTLGLALRPLQRRSGARPG